LGGCITFASKEVQVRWGSDLSIFLLAEVGAVVNDRDITIYLSAKLLAADFYSISR
jgi:hypothetical protein